MMSCLDLLAICAGSPENDIHGQPWDMQLILLTSQGGSSEQLTGLRQRFISREAITDRRNRLLESGSPYRGQTAMDRAALLNPVNDLAYLDFLPPGSARLRLDFSLKTPLLTAEQDSYTLFDNALRKDRLFLLPHLSAASLMGLAVDAYQRTFPPNQSWETLGDNETTRILVYRRQDASAGRLFGLTADEDDTDDEAGTRPNALASGKGRLRCEPAWFHQVQFLVMNPQRPGTATGSQPIQFEAVAPGQAATLELTYFNPAGAAESDENSVRADLARLLLSLAYWWPALGLGAKRLAGYGAIQPLAARLDACSWPSRGDGIHTHDYQGVDAWERLARWIDGEA